MAAFAIGPILILLLVLLGLLISATILRGAIALANKRLGPPPESVYIPADEDDWGDYPIPGQAEPRASVIPTPSAGGRMFTILVIVIVNAAVTFVIRMAVAEDAAVRNGRGADLSELLTLPVGFVLTAGLLAAMLPTTFGRGCLVTLFYFLICVAIAAVILGPIFFLGWAVG